MAEQNDPVMAEVMALLETEPANAPKPAPSLDIPALREQLAILVSTGKCKKGIGANLAQAQMKQLDNKDVVKYHKRYETYIGSKTTASLIDNALSLAIKAVGLVIKIDDADGLKNELKSDFIISKEISQFFGGIELRYGRTLAVVNTAMITAKHVDFSSTEQITEQSSVNTQELVDNTE